MTEHRQTGSGETRRGKPRWLRVLRDLLIVALLAAGVAGLVLVARLASTNNVAEPPFTPREQPLAPPLDGYLKLRFGKTSAQLILRVAYPLESHEARLAASSMSDMPIPCDVLGDLRLNSSPRKLCEFFREAGFDRPRTLFTRTADRFEIEYQRTGPRHLIAPSYQSLLFCAIDARRPPKIKRLIIEALDGATIESADPIPDQIGAKTAAFGRLGDCQHGWIILGIDDRAYLPRPPAPARENATPSLAGMLSTGLAAVLSGQLLQAVRALPYSFLMALPALGFLSIERRRREDARADRAVRSTLNRLVICGWLPFFSVQWLYGGSLWHMLPWRMVGPIWAGHADPVLDVLPAVADLASSAIGLTASAIGALALARLFAWSLRKLGWRFSLPVTRAIALAAMSVGLIMAAGSAVMIGAQLIGDPARAVPFELYVLAVEIPAVLLLLGPVVRFASRALSPSGYYPGYPLLAGAALVIFFPLSPFVDGPGRLDPWTTIPPGLANGINGLAPLAFALTLIPLVALLNPASDVRLKPRVIRDQLGAILFAFAVIGSGDRGWAGLVSVLLALCLLWPRLALAPLAILHKRRSVQSRITTDYPGWAERLSRAQDLREALRGAKLREKLASGEVKPADWSDKRDALEAAYARAVEALGLGGSESVRSFFLGYSIEPDRWENALRAFRFGLPIIGAITFLQATRLFAVPAGHAQPQIAWLLALTDAIAAPAALAVLFGYFFNDLRGTSGLNKALWLAFATTAAQLPNLLTSIGSTPAVAALLWTAGQQFLLLIFIGVIGFDYARMRRVQGRLFDWRRFTWFGDAQLLSTGVITTAAALAPLVAGLVNKDFASALVEGLKSALPVH